jgi:hypothetical protein
MHHKQRGTVSIAPDENCVVPDLNLSPLKVVGSGRGRFSSRAWTVVGSRCIRYRAQCPANGNEQIAPNGLAQPSSEVRLE